MGTDGSAARRTRSRAGRPRSEQSRDAILRATLALLERQSVNGLTIEGIAHEAGVGKATIYRWWPSRTAVVLEALEELPELDAPDLGSFVADLRALLESFRSLLLTTPLGNVLAHLGSEACSRDPEVDGYMVRRTAVGFAVVERAVARGELPVGTDPIAVLPLALGPVLSGAFYGPPPDDAFLDLVVTTVAEGLPVALGPGRASEASPGVTPSRRSGRAARP